MKNRSILLFLALCAPAVALAQPPSEASALNELEARESEARQLRAYVYTRITNPPPRFEVGFANRFSVDFINGGYYLCNPEYPGAQIAISVEL